MESQPKFKKKNMANSKSSEKPSLENEVGSYVVGQLMSSAVLHMHVGRTHWNTHVHTCVHTHKEIKAALNSLYM